MIPVLSKGRNSLQLRKSAAWDFVLTSNFFESLSTQLNRGKCSRTIISQILNLIPFCSFTLEKQTKRVEKAGGKVSSVCEKLLGEQEQITEKYRPLGIPNANKTQN